MKTIQLTEDQAEIVKEMFEHYLDRYKNISLKGYGDVFDPGYRIMQDIIDTINEQCSSEKIEKMNGNVE